MKQKLNQIKDTLKRHHTIVVNFGYLSVMQAFTMLVPLVTLPYLLKVLGDETYGLVVFAQAIVMYFVIVVSFGFNISATKEVSEHLDDHEKLSEIVSSVYIIKGALFFLSLLILSILLFIIPQAKDYKLLFFLSMYAALYEWVFPIWYFRGIEKMKYITIVSLVTRSIFLILVFVLVKEESDFEMVPLINGIGALVAGGSAVWIVFFKHNRRFYWVGMAPLKYYFNESLPIFWGSLIGRLKIVSNKTILGLFVGMESVAIFDIADKLRAVIQSFLDIMVVVVFPNVSKTKNPSSVRTTIKIILSVGVSSYLLTLVALWLLVPLYFEDYQLLVSVFSIVGMVIFLQSSSYMIGVSVMIVNGLKKEYTMSLLMPTVLYLSLVAIAYVIGALNIHSISIILVISMAYEFLFRVHSCRKNGLIHWIK